MTELLVFLVIFCTLMGSFAAVGVGIAVVTEGPAWCLDWLTSWPSKWRLLRDERALAEAKRRSEIRQEMARLQAEEHREALRQLEGR